MNFSDLLAERKKKHTSKLSRYAKYVFNDHFVIIMFFLFGALAYQYTEFLKAIEPPFVIGKLVWIVILAATIFFGKLTTLIQAADAVFLAAKEQEWRTYLSKTKSRSMFVPAFIQFDLLGIAMPMLYLNEELSLITFAALFAVLLLLKWIDLCLQEKSFRINEDVRKHRAALFIFALITLAIGVLLNHWVALGIVLTGLIMLQKTLFQQDRLLDWEKLIQAEEGRVARINRLINLFTDVPSVKNQVRRRKYLDQVVNILAGKENSYQYLYARAFIRGGNYSGLYVRLCVLGTIILFFTNIPLVNGVLNLLFLYVTGFQLVSLYGQYQEHALVRLYPVALAEKRTAFEKILFQLLGMESVLFAIATIFGTNLIVGLIVLAVNLLFSWIFVRFYLRNRTKKTDKWAF